jgi:hypothetical protein
MQRIGLIRFDGKNLPVDRLRFGQATRLMVLDSLESVQRESQAGN